MRKSNLDWLGEKMGRYRVVMTHCERKHEMIFARASVSERNDTEEELMVNENSSSNRKRINKLIYSHSLVLKGLMDMEDNVRNLRRKYESFEKGKEDALTVRDEAKLVLDEAKRTGDSEILEEVGDMLVELEFSIEDNTCKCHRKSFSC